MPNRTNLILSISILLWGLFTFFHLFTSTKEYFDPIVESCVIKGTGLKKNSTSYTHLHIPYLDNMLCILTPFFKDSISHPLGRILAHPLCSMLVSFYLYASIESLDKNKPFIITFAPIWILLAQFVGVSVAVPTVWLSSYWFFKKPGRSAQKPEITEKHFLSLKLIRFATIFFVLSSFSILSFLDRTPQFSWAVTIFILVPVFLCFLWILIPPIFGSRNTFLGIDFINAKEKEYYFFAGGMTVWHMLWFTDFISQGFPIAEIFGLVTSTKVFDQAAYFLFGDFFGLFISTTVFTIVESGFSFVETIKYLITSILLSPGSAFLLNAAHREHSAKNTGIKRPTSSKKKN